MYKKARNIAVPGIGLWRLAFGDQLLKTSF
jgi:hypothetical protein